MAVRIGHASTNNPSSGQAADQVKIGNYYREQNDPWTVVLRPKTKALADKSADLCEAACNNDHVLYSQGSRHTFKNQALKAAGLSSDTNENMVKITAAHIKSITTNCCADCSSLMTFCAVAGGAKFSYGSNAAVVSTMKARFTEYEDYKVLDSEMFLKNSDYLQRGDILLQKGHTVMVLDRGALAPTDGVYEDEYVAIDTVKILVSITNLQSNTITCSVKATQIKDGTEGTLADTEDFGISNWSYGYTSLDSTGNANTLATLTMKSGSSSFTINNLKPNNTYRLRVTANDSDGKAIFSSSNILFTTKQSYPKGISNLSVVFDNSKLEANKAFKLSFTSPSSWGNSNLSKYYRTFLFVNGAKVASSDSALSANRTYSNTKIYLSYITTRSDLFNYGDTIQIGILPILKDSANNVFFDPTALTCSDPLYIKDTFSFVDKLYLNSGSDLKRAILYNNKE